MFFPILTYTRSGSTWLADSVSNRGMWGIDKSKPGIADNFINKDDFLRDYDSIRGNIYLKDPNQT